MSIGGAKKVDEVSRANFSALAEEVGMRPQLVLGRLDSMVKRIVPAAGEVASRLRAEWPSEVYAKIERIIRSQVRHLVHG